MKPMKYALMAVCAAFALSACGKHSKPNFIYMPDMAYSPALKAQEEGMKPPVAGTVARGAFPMPETMEMDQAGKIYQNPLKRTEPVLARGQHLYNTYCTTCHGPNGMGDGSIVPKYPRPPSLQSDKIKGFPDRKSVV